MVSCPRDRIYITIQGSNRGIRLNAEEQFRIFLCCVFQLVFLLMFNLAQDVHNFVQMQASVESFDEKIN